MGRVSFGGAVTAVRNAAGTVGSYIGPGVTSGFKVGKELARVVFGHAAYYAGATATTLATIHYASRGTPLEISVNWAGSDPVRLDASRVSENMSVHPDIAAVVLLCIGAGLREISRRCIEPTRVTQVAQQVGSSSSTDETKTASGRSRRDQSSLTAAAASADAEPLRRSTRKKT